MHNVTELFVLAWYLNKRVLLYFYADQTHVCTRQVRCGTMCGKSTRPKHHYDVCVCGEAPQLPGSLLCPRQPTLPHRARRAHPRNFILGYQGSPPHPRARLYTEIFARVCLDRKTRVLLADAGAEVAPAPKPIEVQGHFERILWVQNPATVVLPPLLSPPASSRPRLFSIVFAIRGRV